MAASEKGLEVRLALEGVLDFVSKNPGAPLALGVGCTDRRGRYKPPRDGQKSLYFAPEVRQRSKVPNEETAQFSVAMWLRTLVEGEPAIESRTLRDPPYDEAAWARWLAEPGNDYPGVRASQDYPRELQRFGQELGLMTRRDAHVRLTQPSVESQLRHLEKLLPAAPYRSPSASSSGRPSWVIGAVFFLTLAVLGVLLAITMRRCTGSTPRGSGGGVSKRSDTKGEREPAKRPERGRLPANGGSPEGTPPRDNPKKGAPSGRQPGRNKGVGAVSPLPRKEDPVPAQPPIAKASAKKEPRKVVLGVGTVVTVRWRARTRTFSVPRSGAPRLIDVPLRVIENVSRTEGSAEPPLEVRIHHDGWKNAELLIWAFDSALLSEVDAPQSLGASSVGAEALGFEKDPPTRRVRVYTLDDGRRDVFVWRNKIGPASDDNLAAWKRGDLDGKKLGLGARRPKNGPVRHDTVAVVKIQAFGVDAYLRLQFVLEPPPPSAGSKSKGDDGK